MAAVREFRHLKKQRRGPMSERGFKDMMQRVCRQETIFMHEWSPSSQCELCQTIVKTGIGRRMCEQPIFPNSLASPITRSHDLRFLVMGRLEI
ncbi:hypothetical protein TNCV_1779581 [Trichonephila clavipes]|nr:hypothetical protein TNCV_1779581 [Trichonephila clavipes]